MSIQEFLTFSGLQGSRRKLQVAFFDSAAGVSILLLDSHFMQKGDQLQADVCIVGSGPAGLTIAEEMEGLGYSVLVLESGGFEHEEESASLNKGRTTHAEGFPTLDVIRARRYGGTANRWAVNLNNSIHGCRMVPFYASDFEKRDWLPDSGWPISRTDLDPYYERAQFLCGLKQYKYDTANWVDETHKPLPIQGDRLHTAMYQFVPGEFFLHTLRSILTLSVCTTIVTHANVQELLTDADGGRVVAAKIANLRGGEFVVNARIFILATGGLENARLLLLSNSKRVAGLGNTYDLVGRYFMDHPQSHGNLLFFSDAAMMARLNFYDMRVVNGDHVMGRFALTESAMRRERLLGITAMLVPRTPGDGSIAVKSLRALARQVLKYRRFPDHIGEHVRSVIMGLPDLAQFAYHRATHTDHHYSIDVGGWSQEEHPEVFNAVELVMSVEQTPHRENRVRLNHEADRLGRLKLDLHNKWRGDDQAHFERIAEVFTQEFERSGIGHFVPNDRFLMTMSSHHPTGTTRMHVNPRHGVVDATARLHDVPNLYVSGSSVFPTDSALNPTLTIMALAIRLADHVKAELNRVAEVSIPQTA